MKELAQQWGCANNIFKDESNYKKDQSKCI